jgi:hypothetical protein
MWSSAAFVCPMIDKIAKTVLCFMCVFVAWVGPSYAQDGSAMSNEMTKFQEHVFSADAPGVPEQVFELAEDEGGRVEFLHRACALRRVPATESHTNIHVRKIAHENRPFFRDCRGAAIERERRSGL